LTTGTEFNPLFEEKFERRAFLGVESFTTAWQKTSRELPAAEAELWLDLVEATNQTLEGY
jgi:hypothetical protein